MPQQRVSMQVRGEAPLPHREQRSGPPSSHRRARRFLLANFRPGPPPISSHSFPFHPFHTFRREPRRNATLPTSPLRAGQHFLLAPIQAAEIRGMRVTKMQLNFTVNARPDSRGIEYRVTGLRKC